MKLEEYDEAIRRFGQALQLSPDDTRLQGQLAQCHIQKHDYESALHIYSRLRFYDPSNLKVLRPIAYCMFILGQLKEAEEVYDEVLSGPAPKTMYDYMNAGHVKLCLGKRREALELYRLSLTGLEFPWASFFQAFEEDISSLVKNGIQAEEIPLLKDYLMYHF